MRRNRRDNPGHYSIAAPDETCDGLVVSTWHASDNWAEDLITPEGNLAVRSEIFRKLAEKLPEESLQNIRQQTRELGERFDEQMGQSMARHKEDALGHIDNAVDQIKAIIKAVKTAAKMPLATPAHCATRQH